VSSEYFSSKTKWKISGCFTVQPYRNGQETY